MVCDRCIMTVQDVLEELGYEVDSVSLGKAEVSEEIDGAAKLTEIDSKLQDKGFELIKKNNEALVEDIKSALIDYLTYLENKDNPVKVSEYLAEKLHHNYSYLSNRFSNYENTTIEQHIIQLKIERVKELLTYEEMTLSEIAYKLNYSSVQYLSNQFKKVMGMTVTAFKKEETISRKSFDTV